jgi:predicted N-acyltransferase
MGNRKTKYHLKIHRAINEISPGDWNGLVTPDTFPFLEWEWLSALEESGSVSADTGWHPFHLGLWDGEKLAAAAPLYLRNSSGGEYVHDYFWAEAAGSMGRPWYPKMVGAPALTPAEGYRFLAAPDLDQGAASAALLEAAETFCRQRRIPSLNLLWADPAWAENLFGYTAWDHIYYLWENENFRDFNDYLSLFSIF